MLRKRAKEEALWVNMSLVTFLKSFKPRSVCSQTRRTRRSQKVRLGTGKVYTIICFFFISENPGQKLLVVSDPNPNLQQNCCEEALWSDKAPNEYLADQF